jgi:hypothetical protein
VRADNLEVPLAQALVVLVSRDLGRRLKGPLAASRAVHTPGTRCRMYAQAVNESFTAPPGPEGSHRRRETTRPGRKTANLQAPKGPTVGSRKF